MQQSSRVGRAEEFLPCSSLVGRGGWAKAAEGLGPPGEEVWDRLGQPLEGLCPLPVCPCQPEASGELDHSPSPVSSGWLQVFVCYGAKHLPSLYLGATLVRESEWAHLPTCL